MSMPIWPPNPPMEGSNAQEIPAGPQWQYEPKWDGFRCLAFRDGPRVELQSKSMKPLARYFPELVAELKQLKATQFALDGEIVVPGAKGFSFDDLLQRIHPAASRIAKLSEERPARLIIFDLLVNSRGKNMALLPLAKRREALEAFAKKVVTKKSRLSLSPATQELSTTQRTINKHVSRVRRMFKWLAAEQLVPVAVFQSLTVVDGLRRGRSVARETEPVLPVDDATVEATLPHLPDVVADMVRIQRLTGMRPAEVCILRPCDIDRSVDPWRYVPESHKTQHRGRERLVFIGPQAQGILLRYLARESESYCFRPCDSEAKRRAAAHRARRTPMSCGNVPGSNRRRRPKFRPGERYNVDAYRRAIHRACDAAFPPIGVLARRPCETFKAWRSRLTIQQRAEMDRWQSDQRWSPNQLRHSAATEIRRRYGLEAAATVLGHAKADVTQIYAERDYALAASVARQIG